MSEPTGIPRDLAPDIAASLPSGLPGGGRGSADGTDNDQPPPNARCGFCDYKYQCLNPGAACAFAIKQAAPQSAAPAAAEPTPEGVWVRYVEVVSPPNHGTKILAFYKDELSALRDAVGQGHKVKMLGWGEQV